MRVDTSKKKVLIKLDEKLKCDRIKRGWQTLEREQRERNRGEKKKQQPLRSDKCSIIIAKFLLSQQKSS